MPTTELDRLPKLGPLYLRAAATTPLRRTDPSRAKLPDTEYVRSGITVDRRHLAEYNRICGFDNRDELPLTYPHITAFPLAVKLMTDPGFPFPLVGLVHVANSITRHEPLSVTDQLTQRVRLSGLRAHPKGTQFDVVTETVVDGRTVWTETSTYLRRGAGDPRAPGTSELAEPESTEPSARWKLPGDLGRRYATVSGDRNPIHLSAVTAKAFGFPRAIAHGMWSAARCLAAFAGRLPRSCAVDVEFAKPVLLPSRVEFTEEAGEQPGRRRFALRSSSGKAHLRGSLRTL
ncbi:MaoC/PaaZ C-terminal domain-containing protein [Actinopolyspora mortivallis]|uniref:MaoC/PaaZ C-terminal domain-containing protein n=1 Tax=Actinopolyspora mortivallis TaxID=33906 RepID=UPI00037464DA|nr:MaoC/PaaZ C-terminal domain-containing protein [Actinopolyspora mortivallis]